MGRPATYKDETRVCVAPDGSSRLQSGGDRRAVVDWLVGEGGCATLAEIDAAFGLSMREVCAALIRAGWLRDTSDTTFCVNCRAPS